MKKNFLFFLFVNVSLYVSAQQKPQYTQYIFDNLLLNPAVTGIENYTDVRAGYRSQWTGLQGAPITNYITISAPVGKNFIYGDPTAFPEAGGEDPGSRSYQQYYQAAEPHHGIGMTIVSDKAGPLTETNVDATYAYHIGLAPQLNLSAGVSAGITYIGLNTAEVSTAVAIDPAITNGNNTQIKPDLSAGVWLYSPYYYVGASVQQLLPEDLYFSTTSSVGQSKTVPHLFLTAGMKLFLSDDMSLLPSFLIKEVRPVPITYDINLKLSFKDVLWIGASYRHNDSVAGLVGFNINSTINVGYSYDVTTSNLNTVSNGTHEIVIGILLNNRYKVTCPQRSF